MGFFRNLIRDVRDGDGARKDVNMKKSMMENVLGLLRVRVKRGVNLAIRDYRSSDPYVIVKMGTQKLKTRVIRKNVYPEWNEDLTLSISDPTKPISLIVYDHDTFSRDDRMGDAEFNIQPFLEAMKMNLQDSPNDAVISKLRPTKDNCLATESCIRWVDGKLVQDLILKLRNVECGEVEIQLLWINRPRMKAS